MTNYLDFKNILFELDVEMMMLNRIETLSLS